VELSPDDYPLPEAVPVPSGAFVKGFDPRRGPPLNGRPPGSGNKIQRDLKEGLINAAIEHGRDGEGEGGLQGYCFHLASKHPRVFAQLLGMVLPLQVTTGGNGKPTVSINIVSIESGDYLSQEDIDRLSTQQGAVEHDASEVVGQPPPEEDSAA
jgi:hypothetical protein